MTILVLFAVLGLAVAARNMVVSRRLRRDYKLLCALARVARWEDEPEGAIMFMPPPQAWLDGVAKQLADEGRVLLERERAS